MATTRTSGGVSRPSTSDRARIDAAVLAELASLRKVIVSQQEENGRFLDHIKMLDGEIDALKEFVGKKQVEICKRDEEIFKQNDVIKELQDGIRMTTINRTAFKVLENQNIELLDRIEKKQKAYEKLEKELKETLEKQSDIRSFADEKVKSAVGVEVELTAKIIDLKEKTFRANKEKTEATIASITSKALADDLAAQVGLSEDRRREQVYRSRTTEYKTLRRIDELTLQLTQTRDEKNQIQESYELSAFRGDKLQETLYVKKQDSEADEAYYQQVLADLEDRMDLTRNRENKMQEAFEHVHAKLQLTQKVFNSLLGKYRTLEQQYEHVKQHGYTPSRLTAEVERSKAVVKHLRPMVPNRTNISATALGAEDFRAVRASQADAPGAGSEVGVGGEHEVVVVSTDDINAQGKASLLDKYLKVVTSQHVHRQQPSSRVIDLSCSAISDGELKNVIAWLRLLPSLADIAKIDLRQNLLSNKSCHTISNWLVSLPSHDFARSSALEVDLRHNMVSKRAVQLLALRIKQVPRPEVKLVCLEEGGTAIAVYGSASALSEGARPRRLIVINLKHNKRRDGKVNDVYAASYDSSRWGDVELGNLKTDVMDAEVDLLMTEHLAQFPRDSIMMSNKP